MVIYQIKFRNDQIQKSENIKMNIPKLNKKWFMFLLILSSKLKTKFIQFLLIQTNEILNPFHCLDQFLALSDSSGLALFASYSDTKVQLVRLCWWVGQEAIIISKTNEGDREPSCRPRFEHFQIVRQWHIPDHEASVRFGRRKRRIIWRWILTELTFRA